MIPSNMLAIFTVGLPLAPTLFQPLIRSVAPFQPLSSPFSSLMMTTRTVVILVHGSRKKTISFRLSQITRHFADSRADGPSKLMGEEFDIREAERHVAGNGDEQCQADLLPAATRTEGEHDRN